MKNYHGTHRQKKYFEGWYIKCQNNKETVAFIFGMQISKQGEKSSFIQMITKDESVSFDFDFSAFKSHKNDFFVQIGENKVDEKGMHLHIAQNGFTIDGDVTFSDFQRFPYHVMGPFRFLPRMECNHAVISMSHKLEGQLRINSRKYIFYPGSCYIEQDYGRSFPIQYLWTQCNRYPDTEQVSIMAAHAKIPYLGLKFNGFLAVVQIGDRIYRLGTYFCGRTIKHTDTQLIIQSFSSRLEIQLLQQNEFPLLAPNLGKMNRIIKESATCQVHYRFFHHGHLLIDSVSNQASFEFSSIN